VDSSWAELPSAGLSAAAVFPSLAPIPTHNAAPPGNS
jgi:hypothetical protein